LNIRKIAQLTGHKASIFALAATENAQYFLSGGGDGWIVRWDLQNPEMGKLLAKAEGNIYSLCQLIEEDLIVAGNMEGGVHWIDLKDSENNRDILHHKKGVYDIRKVGAHLITLGGSGLLTKWSISERRTLESLQISNQSLRSSAYFAPRNELAIAASDNNIYILDATSWQIKKTISGAHDNSVFSVQFSLKGDRLWSGGRDAHLRVWSVEQDFEPVFSVPGHWYTINALALHPEGKWLATASRDKTIKIWDAETFELLKVIETIRDGGHINSVNALYWSSYNNYLISCSDDRSIIVWQIEQ
jgi:WD40 repeat protein